MFRRKSNELLKIREEKFIMENFEDISKLSFFRRKDIVFVDL